MASTYSPTLRLELIGTGDQSGIWGDTTNNNLGALIEQAITGVVTIAMSDANYTLSALNGSVDQARNAVLIATGTLSAQRNIVAPLVEKTYTIKNSTTGGFGIQIIGASGTGVVIANGQTQSVFCDGTNFYPAFVGGTTVSGPASSTDNAIARFDGTTGAIIQNSNVTISDVGAISTGSTITATGTVTGGSISTGGGVTATGTVTGGAISTGGGVTATGAVSGGSVTSSSTVTVGTSLVFSSSTPKILGDFSGVGSTDRLVFQTTVTNNNTGLRVLPNGTSTNANIGFGSNSADLSNTSLCTIGIEGSTGTGFVNTYGVGSATGYPLTFGTNTGTGGIERMRITTSGEVMIAGTTDQGAYNLQVNGTGVWGAGAYVNGSDAKLKENVAELGSCLDVVKAMRPVTYQYKESYSKDRSTQPGFIAQDLQTAMAGKNYLSGVVQEGPKHLNVAYQNIIPILTKAIQEQQAQIEQLIAEVAALKGA